MRTPGNTDTQLAKCHPVCSLADCKGNTVLTSLGCNPRHPCYLSLCLTKTMYSQMVILSTNWSGYFWLNTKRYFRWFSSNVSSKMSCSNSVTTGKYFAQLHWIAKAGRQAKWATKQNYTTSFTPEDCTTLLNHFWGCGMLVKYRCLNNAVFLSIDILITCSRTHWTRACHLN